MLNPRQRALDFVKNRAARRAGKKATRVFDDEAALCSMQIEEIFLHLHTSVCRLTLARAENLSTPKRARLEHPRHVRPGAGAEMRARKPHR